MNQKVDFESTAYSITAIQKAAYRCSRFITIDIKLENEKITCELQQLHGCSNDDYIAAVEEFQKNALDYALREKISRDTEAVRNMILGLAFSRSGLIDE